MDERKKPGVKSFFEPHHDAYILDTVRSAYEQGKARREIYSDFLKDHPNDFPKKHQPKFGTFDNHARSLGIYSKKPTEKKAFTEEQRAERRAFSQKWLDSFQKNFKRMIFTDGSWAQYNHVWGYRKV
jgi:hypothetical protein